MVSDAPVILFDGMCNFCDFAVHFIIDHERTSTLKFASIQSEAAAKLLERAASTEKARALTQGLRGGGDPNSVVLIERGHIYTHSTAGLRVARYLRWPWSWFGAFVVVPRPLRDLLYRWFARHRYQWFGKTEACRVPTPELRARFL